MADLFSISSDVLPSHTHVVSIRGQEGLSQIYELAIGLLIRDDSFNTDDAIRGRATVTIHLEDGSGSFVLNGMIIALEHLHEWTDQALYRATIVPQLWDLTQTFHSRIFTDASIPEIIEAVLEDTGLTSDQFSLQLQGDYPAKDHVCQYKESNFSFISRWMEREGMYYFFEQGDDAEKLIITDVYSHEDLRSAPVRYVPLSGEDAMAVEAFNSFALKHTALPANVELADYDYLNPDLAVTGSAEVASEGQGIIRRFGDDLATPDDCSRLAQLQAEQYLAQQKIFHGRGRVFSLRPGNTFSVEEHPRSSYNASYLTTELEHIGNQSSQAPQICQILGIGSEDEYSVAVRAISADVQYRTKQRHRWPRIDGVESAVVCGEADSDYAQIDEHGRYKVRVKFDESDLTDGSASTWVRMLQPHGGVNEGFHFPLRKGTEVLLIFLGGHPDRPMLASVGPDPQRPSPVTDSNHTKNIIQTGGLNLIEMEDQDGSQYNYIYTPPETTYIHMGADKDGFNFIINTEGHCHFNIGGDQQIDVKGDLTETVDGDVTENYNSNQSSTIADNQSIDVGGDLSEHVVGNVAENYDANHDKIILGDQTISLTGNRKEAVVGTVTESVVGAITETYTSDHTTTAMANRTQTVLGNVTQTVAGNVTQTIAGTYNQTVGQKNWFNMGTSASVTLAATTETYIGLKNSNFIGGQLNINIGAAINLSYSLAFSMAFSMALEMALSGKVSLVAGAEIDVFAGPKLTAATGPEGYIVGGPFIEVEAIKCTL